MSKLLRIFVETAIEQTSQFHHKIDKRQQKPEQKLNKNLSSKLNFSSFIERILHQNGSSRSFNFLTTDLNQVIKKVSKIKLHFMFFSGIIF